VTIAIGVISSTKDYPAIFLASDSQTTYGGGPKSLDARKIRKVEFANGEVLVASPGSAELADKAFEIMRRDAIDKTITDDQTVPGVAANAMRTIRAHFKDINQGIISSEDGWKRFFVEEAYIELIVGYFLKGAPQLFTIDIDWALPVKVSSYKAIGAGKHMAELFLSEYRKPDPSFSHALPISVSVVEKVISVVEGCGGPTWVGIAFSISDPPEGKTTIAAVYSRGIIDALAEELKKVDAKLSRAMGKEAGAALEKIHRKFFPDFYEYMRKHKT